MGSKRHLGGVVQENNGTEFRETRRILVCLSSSFDSEASPYLTILPSLPQEQLLVLCCCPAVGRKSPGPCLVLHRGMDQ
jgi:hypothetical protein